MTNLKSLVVRRLGLGAFVLFFVSFVSFIILYFSPGSAAVVRSGNIDPEQIQQIEESLGLNQPFHIQYFDWLTDVLSGDLGKSLVSGQDILPLLIQKSAVSGELAILGFMWMLVLSTILGLASAFRRNQLSDHVARIYAVLGISIPDFVVGTFLIYLFGVHLGWLPSGRWIPISEGIVENLRHAILPSFTVGFLFTAIVTRVFRSDLLETIDSEHVTASKAMGVPKNERIVSDIIRPAIIPTITTLGMTIPLLFSGIVLAEYVFAVPGIGRYAVQSVYSGDYPVVQAIMLVVGSLFIVVNILVDILYYYLDPRIGVSSE